MLKPPRLRRPPEPPSAPGPHSPAPKSAPGPERHEAKLWGWGKWGSGEVAGWRPLPCFSFAKRVSLPKSLEKFLSLPASQPLKAGEAGAGRGEPAAASCSCLRLQFPIQPTPQVLPLYPCGSFNVPGSRVSSFLTRASGPEFTSLPQCSPLPTSHHHRSPSSFGPVSVPSPTPSSAHTRGACTFQEPGGPPQKKV